MKLFADILLLLIAVLHLYIPVLEMFLWRAPLGRRAFGTTAEFAAPRGYWPPIRGCTTVFWRWGWHGATGVRTWRCSCSRVRVGGRGVRQADRQPQDLVGAGVAGLDRDAGGMALTRRFTAGVRRILVNDVQRRVDVQIDAQIRRKS